MSISAQTPGYEAEEIVLFLTFLIQIQLQKYRNAAYMPNFWDKLRRNVISGDRFIICIGR